MYRFTINAATDVMPPRHMLYTPELSPEQLCRELEKFDGEVEYGFFVERVSGITGHPGAAAMLYAETETAEEIKSILEKRGIKHAMASNLIEETETIIPVRTTAD